MKEFNCESENYRYLIVETDINKFYAVMDKDVNLDKEKIFFMLLNFKLPERIEINKVIKVFGFETFFVVKDKIIIKSLKTNHFFIVLSTVKNRNISIEDLDRELTKENITIDTMCKTTIEKAFKKPHIDQLIIKEYSNEYLGVYKIYKTNKLRGAIILKDKIGFYINTKFNARTYVADKNTSNEELIEEIIEKNQSDFND